VATDRYEISTRIAVSIAIRARQTAQVTDDERFSMINSIGGATRFTGGVRDERYPNNAPLTGGYTPGVPRLGVPALLSPATMRNRNSSRQVP
jgi:hypothetical protein